MEFKTDFAHYWLLFLNSDGEVRVRIKDRVMVRFGVGVAVR